METLHLENYQLIRIIAVGAYGEIYEALNLIDNRRVAIKRMIRNQNDGPGLQSTSIREISLIKSLNSPQIVEIKDTIIKEEDLFIVLELLQGDLKSRIRNLGEQHFSQATLKKYMYQLLQATEHFHSHKIIHRDLKPENLLIDAHDNLKVADFGLSRKIFYPPRPYTLGVVTQPYRAPQILVQQAEYNQKIDIWSIGCIFAEMITKKIFFYPDGDSFFGQLPSIIRRLGNPDENQWPEWPNLWQKFQQNRQIQINLGVYPPTPLEEQIGKQMLEPQGFDLMKKMLVYNPARRISAAESLLHPYFNDIN